MKKEYIIILFLLAVIIIFSLFPKKIKTQMSKLSRGYRNNNPGNIEKTSQLWQGETKGTDERFKSFINMGYGYRAIFVLLRSYIGKNFNTIEKILNRYAPAHENITHKYIETVSKTTGISPTKILKFENSKDIKKIVAAISFVENGVHPDLLQVNEGFKLI